MLELVSRLRDHSGPWQLPLIRAVVLDPRQGGPCLHVQVLGGHVTRVDGGEAIQEGTSRGWQLFEGLCRATTTVGEFSSSSKSSEVGPASLGAG